MKILYFIQVALVSLEALVLVIAVLAWTYFHVEIQAFAASLSLNEEVLKYLMLLPVAIAVWVINESRLLLQEDKETVRILIDWEDYWKLKIHMWVSLSYAVVFAFLSIALWVNTSGIGSGAGMLLFLASIAGQLSLAASIYAARIRVKEILGHAKAP